MRRGLILWFLCSDFLASVFADIYLQIIYTDWNYLIFFFTDIVSVEGFRGGSDGICLQYRWAGFDPWVGKIPRRRAWQPTPVFFPGESHGQRSLAGYSPRDRRVRHDWVTDHSTVSRQTWCVVISYHIIVISYDIICHISFHGKQNNIQPPSPIKWLRLNPQNLWMLHSMEKGN